MNNLAENKYGHNGFRHSKIKRFFRRKYRKIVGRHICASQPFDFQTGYDVRDKIGQITIKDQGQSSSCGGQASSYLVEIIRRLQGINEGQLSAKSFYALHENGGGMSVSQLETQVCAHGGNLESSVPSYTPQGAPLDEQAYEDTSWQTLELKNDAETRAGFVPNDVAIDIDSIAWAVSQYPCVWIIEGQNGQTPSWDSSTPQPPSPENPNEIWAHWECIIGTNKGQRQLAVLNSWGPNVGNQGIQYFDENYINSGYVVEVIAFVPDSQLKPIPNTYPQTVWQWLWYYFMGKPLPLPSQ